MGKKIFGIYLAKLDAPNSEAHARLELLKGVLSTYTESFVKAH